MTTSPAVDDLRATLNRTAAGRDLLAVCTLAQRFESADTFGAFTAAEAWLKTHGLQAGSTSYRDPVAVIRDVDHFEGSSKWRNLYPDTIRQLAGVVVGERRNGPVEVWLRVGVLS